MKRSRAHRILEQAGFLKAQRPKSVIFNTPAMSKGGSMAQGSGTPAGADGAGSYKQAAANVSKRMRGMKKSLKPMLGTEPFKQDSSRLRNYKNPRSKF